MKPITALGILKGLAMAAFGLVITAGESWSQSDAAAPRTERYVPTIWVDPDGCEHWVMDDGFEGFMTPHVTRDGKPVCRRGNLCGEVGSDQLFASDSARISSAGRARLHRFFQQTSARGFVITGHTDSRASDAYNMNLSLRRANAVAQIAKATGARINGVRGYGERQPKASNATSAGRAQNRRVEIMCLR